MATHSSSLLARPFLATYPLDSPGGMIPIHELFRQVLSNPTLDCRGGLLLQLLKFRFAQAVSALDDNLSLTLFLCSLHSIKSKTDPQ